jgi:hypothetical protein
MFSSLKSKDSHRVDYLNFDMVGSGRAFGLYVRGQLAANQPYSVEAKRRLYASMDFVRRYLDEKNLIAVYMDVCHSGQQESKAFQQLAEDLHKGYFNKVLFADLEELFVNGSMYEKMMELSEKVEGLEFFDLKGNLFQANRLPLNQLLGL